MITVAEICRNYGAEFLNFYKLKLPAYKKTALWCLANCRTAALGGRVTECTECGHREYRYNSCRHRGCPQCEGSKEAGWMRARESELLPTHYFHIVFTVPHVLNELFIKNQRICFAIFFRSVAKALSTVMRDRLKAQVGFFAIMHTWGQRLDFHPHIHCVVPGGGVTNDGLWIATSKKRRYFAPTKVLAEVFRGILIKALKRAHKDRKLTFTGDLEALLNSSSKKPWVVHAEPPFGSAIQVLKYLSRYTRKVAISNSRLVSLEDNKVTFSFKDYAEQSEKKLCRMPVLEFIRRFLLHIPPRAFVRIRHYGFLAGKNRKIRIQNLKEVIAGLLPVLATLTATAIKESCALGLCPKCKVGVLILIEIIPRAIIKADSS